MGRHAKESGATFVNITASGLTSKRFGESNKLVVGLFNIARSQNDHEATAMMKAEIMVYVASTMIPVSQFHPSLGWPSLGLGSDIDNARHEQNSRH
jgi:hypothetical protein